MILFTASYCQPCKGVKGYIASKNLPVIVADIGEQEWMQLAKEKDVRSVPTLVTDEGMLVIGAKTIISYLEDK